MTRRPARIRGQFKKNGCLSACGRQPDSNNLKLDPLPQPLSVSMSSRNVPAGSPNHVRVTRFLSKSLPKVS
jgi:hypothetical protein